MPINDEFQLTFVQRVHDTRLTNVFTYQQTSADGTGDAKLALGTGWFASTAHADYVALLGPKWTDKCAAIRKLNVPGQDYFRVEASPDVGGAVDTLNPATAIQLVMYPAGSGPGQQGSVYISGAPTGDEDRNNLAQPRHATYVAWSAKFIIPIINSGYTFQMGLPSRPFIAAGPGDPPDPPGQSALAFRPFVLSDVRVPLTKIRSRRLDTRC
ncbi:unnamed protein product [marine sediment metagenome]|uniref:Uncharacterized protein n=1 Tax=marine sediment metagenome TaxID=412755 RepID=X1A7U5_9ZZZZ